MHQLMMPEAVSYGHQTDHGRTPKPRHNRAIDNSEEMLAPIITDLTGIDEDDPRCSYIIMQIVAGVVTPILFITE